MDVSLWVFGHFSNLRLGENIKFNYYNKGRSKAIIAIFH
jgi:hypothetical protein